MVSLSAIRLGAAVGARSMLPVAGLSWAASTGRLSLPSTFPISLLDNPNVTIALEVMEGGEMVADKLPFTPSRIFPPSTLFRLGVGAAVGSVSALVEDSTLWEGALAGAVSAVAANYGLYYARKGVDSLGLPDPIAGLLEDIAALALVYWTVTSMESKRRGPLGIVTSRLPFGR